MEETRLILNNAGKINPVSSQEYAASGGYAALKKAIAAPGDVIGIVSDSGVLGRGGAGFPVGLKWSIVKKTPADQKYVVCNADEGEPGTGKDRVILSGDPHALIEGMTICAIAVGADKGFIYLRAEYPYLRDPLEQALADARANGYLGAGILGSSFHFDIEMRSGQGSYVCGEETALIESLEGRRGEPRYKPPFPGVKGLWGKPTVINNVETFVNIPVILTMGAAGYRKYGTEKCPGTKLFTLSGNIRNPGVYEFPTGVTIRQLFEEVGGGCPGGKKLLGIQTGGASGAIIRADRLDTRLDIENCAAAGAVFGAGDLMFFDEDTCVIDLCKNLTEFFAGESCGKCTPCSLGIRQMLDILTKIANGKATLESLNELEKWAKYIKKTSLCGLGQMAPTPVLSTLENFRNEYEAHINHVGRVHALQRCRH
ncbi:MAG: NADH-ubiquinone oxidoreductase-F iron-sulfur binding region domain-containing protein [Chloroflexota bacterium]